MNATGPHGSGRMWGQMRLTCPNCGAVYEVDDNAIPPEGRDVQCSSCGHGWFQPPPGAGADPAATLGTAASPFAGEDAPAGDATAPAGEDDTTSAPGQATPRRPRHRMDEAVRSILREEAERDSRTRRAGPDGLESQSDLGLAPGAGGRTHGHEDATAPPQTEDEGDRPEESGAHGPDPDPAPWEESDFGPAGTTDRKARFADIEDVSETLAAHETPGADQAALSALPDSGAAPRRNRFGLGLGIALLIGATAVAVYLYAPAIVKLVPAARPVLVDYVSVVDMLRIEARQALLPVAEALRGVLGSAGR